LSYKLSKKSILKIFILLCIITVLGCIINHYLQYRCFYPLKYYEEVSTNADKYDIDPLLIMALIKAESNFEPEAVSHKDAVGLMQITPSTASWAAERMGMEDFSTEKLSQPEINIAIGVWYIDYLLDYYDGNLQLALAAYNAGTGTVDKWYAENKIEQQGDLISLPYDETTNYIIKTRTYYERYKQMYDK
jgi:soluble lytic murein transglycosylase